MQLVFATHNTHKFQEVCELMPGHIRLLSLTDIQCFEEIEENGATLEENAQLKADYVTTHYGLPCFADDTGLLVDVLNGAPGVYTARYAGPQKNAQDNMDKLLRELESTANRKAHFKTVIALNIHKGKHLFSGIVNGEITKEKQGEGGFGYDPIFKPHGYDATFAELPLKIKNSIGHRGKAIAQLLTYLSNLPV